MPSAAGESLEASQNITFSHILFPWRDCSSLLNTTDSK